MSSSVQFFGTEQVITAAENRKVPAWAIWQSRQFMFKYEGSDLDESLQLLEQTLQMLANNQTTATYTIKFFESANKINEKTVCDGGSFNFKLMPADERQALQLSYQANSPKVIEALGRIEQRLELLENGSDEDEEEEEPQDIKGMVMGYINQPSKLMELANALNSIKGLLGFPVNQVPAHYIGNVHQVGQNEPGRPDDQREPGENLSQQNYEADLQRLGTAVDKLQQHDPKIVEHLEKLARMAETNPQQFTGLLSMLDLIP